MGGIISYFIKTYWHEDEGNISPGSADSRRERVTDIDNPDSGQRVAQEEHGSGSLIPEALPNIRLLVNHELPDGTGNEHSITVDPYNTVSQLRGTMETFTGIPQENIYFIFRMSELVDSLSLFQQQITSWDRVTLRDNRLTYPYPY